MQSYIMRRRRWWALLKQLDSSIHLSTEHRGDLLLDAARIQPWQRQMILTSTGNSTELKKVEDALMEQMSDYHKAERGGGAPTGSSRGDGRSGGR